MIDYKLLADSIEFYESKGFKRIEAPWTVSEYVDSITKPEDRPHYQLKHNDKCLVASGEQSFLYLYLKEYLPLGRYQTVTPCFRYEAYDLFHEKTFMKNELIITDDVSKTNLKMLIDSAMEFFKLKVPYKEKLKSVKIEDSKDIIQYDIMYGDIELGSYGIRHTHFLKWIYGTGCAEPRLSKVINYDTDGRAE